MNYRTPRGNGRKMMAMNTLALVALASAGPPTVSACKNTKYSDNTDIGASLNASPQNFIDSGGSLSPAMANLDGTPVAKVDQGNQALGVSKAGLDTTRGAR